MRRFITKSLIALIVLGAAIGGANSGGFFGFVGGLIGGTIMSIVIFGALFVLMDISDNTRRTADLLERQNQG